MEDKFSRVSGKSIIDEKLHELEKKGERYNFESSVYTIHDDHEIEELFNENSVTIENIEQLKKYVVERINAINIYGSDFIKEKGLTCVFREIYRFNNRPDFDEFEQPLIDELIDYIYDNSTYPANKVDDIAYYDITNKGNSR